MLEKRLQQIFQEGTLTVIAPDGARRHFDSGAPAVAIRLTRPGLGLRLLLDAEIALPEA